MNFLDAWLALSWREPLWLLLLLYPVVLVIILKHKRNNTYRRYAEKALHPWVVLRKKYAFHQRLISGNNAFLLAWVFISLSLAGPRIPQKIAGEEYKTGVDIMIVVDVSRSMGVEDVVPNRLRRAQLELYELLEQAKNNRMGIILFAARAHVYIPLTSDMDALRFYLSNLDSLLLPTQGSQPATALQLAHEELIKSSTNSAIVILSDGDFSHNREEVNVDSLQNVIKDLNDVNIPVFSLGIGTLEGDAIPLQDSGWLKHNGQHVISSLDESVLKKMAEATSGDFTPVFDDSRDWQKLYENGIAELGGDYDVEASDKRIIWKELYAWTLLPAMILLLLAYSANLFKLKVKSLRTVSSLVVLLGLLLTAPDYSVAAGLEKKAYRLYQLKDYSTAASTYKQLAGFTARFGEGASRYRAGDYNGAIQQYKKAILLAENDNARASALFNLGNSYFKNGDYRTAVTAYQDSLLYRSPAEATQHNLQLSLTLQKAVEKRIQQLIASGRIGSGPRRVRLREGTEIPDKGAVFIDESSEVKGDEQGLPDLPGQSDEALQALVQRGLEFVQFAEQRDRQSSTLPGDTGQLPILDAQQYMNDLQDNSAVLWKRIFEIEEGFPAPLEQPRQVPGVLPW